MKKLTRFALFGLALLVVLADGSWSSGQDATPDIDAVFKRLDKNGDGKISASEIPEEQARYFERLLRRANKEANGELTRDEFRQASQPDERPNVPLGNSGPEQGRGDARQRFEMLDRNKDGKVTLDEVPEQIRDRIKPLFERAGKQELTLEDFARFGGPGNRPDPAELFKRFDTNADGKLSKDELPAEMRERLAPLFDRLGKSELTLDDVKQAREAAGRPEGQPGGNPEEMFARLDVNSDGKLTANEVPERARPMVENVLRLAGKDREGSVTKEEFVKNFPALASRGGNGNQRPDGERRPEGDRPTAERSADAPARTGERRTDGMPPEGRGPLLFRMLDTNRDGHISKEELAKITDLFDQLDRNHDGQLDPQELIGPSPAMDGRRGGLQPAGGGREPARSNASRSGEAPNRERTDGRQEGARNPGAFFQRIDSNGDGKISKDEAPALMKDKFAMLDTNGDGFVTQDELRAGAQLLGDGFRGRQPERSKPE